MGQVNFIDPMQEAEVKAFHRGEERARLSTPPRVRSHEDVFEEAPRPASRVTFQYPKISAEEAEAEIQFDLAEASMTGVLD